MGVVSRGSRTEDGARWREMARDGVLQQRGQPRSAEIGGKGVGQTLALALGLGLGLTLVLAGQRNARATTAASRWSTWYMQGGWKTVTPRLKGEGGLYPTAVSP